MAIIVGQGDYKYEIKENWAKLPDGWSFKEMAAVVGQVDRVVGAHMDAVGARILAFAPGAQKISLAVEHHHRVLAAPEGVDIVVLVDADRGHFLERPFVWQFRPILDDPVFVVAVANDDRQCISPQWTRSYFCKARNPGGCGWPGNSPGHKVQHTSPT